MVIAARVCSAHCSRSARRLPVFGGGSCGASRWAATSLVQYAPAPRVLVFALLTAAFVAAAAVLTLIPETAERRPGALASLLPRARVPRPARRAFVGALPGLIAVWALGGLVISTLMASATLASLLLRGRAPRSTTRLGSAALCIGVLGTLTALGVHSVTLFFAMTAVSDFGFGAAFLGSLSGVAPLAAPDERAELFAAVYGVSYLAFGTPAVVAGFAAPHLGLLHTALWYGGAVALLAAVSLATTMTCRSDPASLSSGQAPVGAGSR
ncbi:hypothetical protein [Kitasatospora griseola]|uniref:hypothetical protein n=1 Tax=Kitasatospora griseola TaxID=2064 RepID=UPI003801136B